MGEIFIASCFVGESVQVLETVLEGNMGKFWWHCC